MDRSGILFDWNHARAFMFVAQNGSLTAAAKLLSTTQPTIGRQVQAFEEQIGATLFERTGNQLVLTEQGSLLLQKLERMSFAAEQVTLSAQDSSQTLQGKVTVSCSELDAIYRLPPIVKQLHERFPHIEIEIIVTNQVSDLLQREADIAIRAFRPKQDNLIAKKIKFERIGFYGTLSYINNILASVNGSSVSSLSNELHSKNRNKIPDSTFLNCFKIIGFEDVDMMLDRMKMAGWHITREQIVAVTSNQALQIELAKQGLGLILLPKDIAQSSDIPLIDAFPDSPSLFELEVWLVCNQSLRTSRRVNVVYQALAEHLSL
jgi:DNA-binding transcriptional LysR family regulator